MRTILAFTMIVLAESAFATDFPVTDQDRALGGRMNPIIKEPIK